MFEASGLVFLQRIVWRSRLLHGEVEAEGLGLEILVAQTALVEEAVLAGLQGLVEGDLEGVVVDGLDVEVDHLAGAGVLALEAGHGVRHAAGEQTAAALLAVLDLHLDELELVGALYAVHHHLIVVGGVLVEGLARLLVEEEAEDGLCAGLDL